MEAITISLKHDKWCFPFLEIVQELISFTSYDITCQICGAENAPDQLGDTSTLADPSVVDALLDNRRGA